MKKLKKKESLRLYALRQNEITPSYELFYYCPYCEANQPFDIEWPYCLECDKPVNTKKVISMDDL